MVSFAESCLANHAGPSRAIDLKNLARSSRLDEVAALAEQGGGEHRQREEAALLPVTGHDDAAAALGDQVVLHIGGAESVHAVYVNGAFVGYGTDAQEMLAAQRYSEMYLVQQETAQ